MTWEFSSSILSVVAERKIQEAMAEGQFDNLPGRGQPQNLEDLSGLPEDLRLAYIVLKNSGYTDLNPSETLNAQALLAQAPEEATACRRLDKLRARFGSKPGQKVWGRLAQSPYLAKVLEKL
ncbi:MAG: DUF1992 domain-containing protein [Deltaproteobacteria bacterium]|jgi:hypothetical protein|nr:DUF1992 domain-containing protein [Deltaproteobacteria bacterium]